MQFLLLWSGDVKGMRKARINGVTNKNRYVGHSRDGKCYVPDATALRDALPKRFHAAWDRQAKGDTICHLPQVWTDARNNDAPLTIRLLYARGGNMVTLYLQPLKDGVAA